MSSKLCTTMLYGVAVVLCIFTHIPANEAECSNGASVTFVRWSGLSPERAAPVFVYTASGEEDSLIGSCLARCRELEDCASLVVSHSTGNCHGVALATDLQLRSDNDASYFKKICLKLPAECKDRWWALEATPGYNLHAEGPNIKVFHNTTLNGCYDVMFSINRESIYRSAQWIGPEILMNNDLMETSAADIGNCILNVEDKFSEPESYRVTNYYTVYIENQCRHDYPKKIDRCSYEEYNNQTLRHVDFTTKNYTKDECKIGCEVEQRFVCRGFTWIEGGRARGRGLCDLHSEDLVTTGSWLLRRNSAATYYRRVICLNITVECEGSELIVTYRPRGLFRGRLYVPGRGERCSTRASGGPVRLSLPLYGDCDVNFAYAITNSPTGVTNRTMAYVMVMIQNNPIIQTAGDRWVRVGCSPAIGGGAQAVDTTVAVRETGRPSLPSELASAATPGAASTVYSTNSAPLTMYVVRAQDDTATGSGAVSLGEPLELRIETTDAAEIEAYHLVASSRLGDSSVLLLDSRGCPTGQVDFPSFTRSWFSGTQRLSANFKAFRFPTSHVVRFALMVRFCEKKCPITNCGTPNRTAREVNDTNEADEVMAAVREAGWAGGRSGVVAQGGAAGCGSPTDGHVPLELEMVVGARDILSADTLVRADHRAALPEEVQTSGDGAMVCVHELLLVALALAWLAVQVLLLLGCCVLVKRYRNLAEMSMQKEYQAFDNVGFDTVSTHRRVHWPDQNIDILHTT
ncbi:uncharacterized protein LOC113512589 [Galleria mellonella]|uniref:Uncharacterized protein LOC113512589 n=1 Tax=Galleria mellonella TaxID=7137 RepID=A0ABM3MXT9_GALME|nr:uncharacterized protein LOC113512589 [Galleria mellonella]